MPDVQAPYFHPARDGGNQKSPYLYPAQDGGRSQDIDGNNIETETQATRGPHGETIKKTANRPGLQHEGPPRAEPTEQGRAAEKKDMPEPISEKGNMNTTRGDSIAASGEEQPDCDPIQAWATQGEAIEHIGSYTSEIRGNPGRRLPLPCKPTCEPRICTASGTAANNQTVARQTKNGHQRAPYLYPARDGGINQREPAKMTMLTKNTCHEKQETRTASPGGHHGSHPTSLPDTKRTHQDAKNNGSNDTEQHALTEKLQPHSHSQGRRPLVTRAMQSLPSLDGTNEQGTLSPAPLAVQL